MFLACVTMTVVLVLAMCLGYVHPLKWVAADWFALGIMLWICSRWIYLESEKESARELADLRAYKERTEAGLVDLCDSAEDEAFETLHYRLGKRGLWRDPPQAEVKP